jgi:hypothetical protein
MKEKTEIENLLTYSAGGSKLKVNVTRQLKK